MPEYQGDAKKLLELTLAAQQMDEEFQIPLVQGAYGLASPNLPPPITKGIAYVAGGVVGETLQSGGDPVEGMFKFTIANPIKKFQVVGMTAEPTGKLNDNVVTDIVNQDLITAAEMFLTDAPKESAIPGLVASQSKSYEKKLAALVNSFGQQGIPREYPNGTRYGVTDEIVHGPVTKGERFAIKLEQMLESQIDLKNKFKGKIASVKKTITDYFIGSGSGNNGTNYNDTVSVPKPKFESKIPISPADAGPIPPGGGPGAISPKARGSI